MPLDLGAEDGKFRHGPQLRHCETGSGNKEGKRNEEISVCRSSTNERLGGDTIIERNVDGNLRIADGLEADYVDQSAAISVRAWQPVIRN